MKINAMYGDSGLEVDYIDDVDGCDNEEELQPIPCEGREEVRPAGVLAVPEDLVERDGDEAGYEQRTVSEGMALRPAELKLLKHLHEVSHEREDPAYKGIRSVCVRRAGEAAIDSRRQRCS